MQWNKYNKYVMFGTLSVSIVGLSGCVANYEQRPVPWVKAKVYQAVEMTGVIERTYIRKPDYYMPYRVVPTGFQACQNYYLSDVRCVTPVQQVYQTPQAAPTYLIAK